MNQNEIFEKIEKIESELQSLKSMIKTFTENTEYTPANVLNLPAKFPVDVVEEENGKIIDIFPESYDPKEFDIEDGILHEYLGNSEEVTIPYGVTRIGHDAFKNNQTIKKVNLSDTVTEIGENAFYCCVNLVEVNNIKNIITIHSYAFCDCGSLEKLRFSKNIKEIGQGAFWGCKNLSISIPATCKFDNKSFYKCKNVVIREVEK